MSTWRCRRFSRQHRKGSLIWPPLDRWTYVKDQDKKAMLDRTDEGHEAHEILKWINQSSSISPPPLVLFFLNGSAFNLSFWDFVQWVFSSVSSLKIWSHGKLLWKMTTNCFLLCVCVFLEYVCLIAYIVVHVFKDGKWVSLCCNVCFSLLIQQR